MRFEFGFNTTHVFTCHVFSPIDVVSARVQDSPAEPPLQVLSPGEDRGVEGSIRLPLQGFARAQDEQEASKDS